ncbi:MAG TPA: hypothetical protein VHT24_12995 [Pseudacidobacterium sp.]|nr:hypothetical protein [Pseudacidobacterium sp.]
MIKGSLALMLSHGQRPRKQLGHHIAIIEFAQKNLPGCPAGTFALLDRMRRKRNDAFYDIALVSDTEAPEAVATAEAYLLACDRWFVAVLPEGRNEPFCGFPHLLPFRIHSR